MYLIFKLCNRTKKVEISNSKKWWCFGKYLQLKKKRKLVKRRQATREAPRYFGGRKQNSEAHSLKGIERPSY
ncbi:hypothetical protein EFL42_03505 [Lactococcus cremoris]|nr:hypothetical protein [Lactococcus cremoris]